jgi:hypothetical protein
LLGFAISAVIRWQNDFYIYRDAGLRAVLDQRIYDLDALNPFQYAPIYAVFFIPFGWLPVHWAQALWFLISMGAALPALILGSGRLLFGAASKLRADLIVVRLFLCTRFILPSFDKGQIDLLVLAMTAWGVEAIVEPRQPPDLTVMAEDSERRSSLRIRGFGPSSVVGSARVGRARFGRTCFG